MGPIRSTRSAVIISAVVHGGALVLAVLFTGANPLNSEATEAISVDIVSPSEAPPAPDPWAVPKEQSIEPPKPTFDVAALTPTPPMPPQPQPEAKPARRPRRHSRKRGEARRRPLPPSKARNSARRRPRRRLPRRRPLRRRLRRSRPRRPR